MGMNQADVIFCLEFYAEVCKKWYDLANARTVAVEVYFNGTCVKDGHAWGTKDRWRRSCHIKELKLD